MVITSQQESLKNRNDRLEPTITVTEEVEEADDDLLDTAHKTVKLYIQPGLGREGSRQVYDDTSGKYDQVGL